MEIDLQTIGAVSVIRPLGPITNTEDAQQFRDRAIESISLAKGRVVVDAEELSYVDSSGLEALLDVAERLEALGQGLKLGQVNETLSDAIRVTKLTDHFEPFDSVQDAVRSYR
jgi:anti-anti-sigma factor